MTANVSVRPKRKPGFFLPQYTQNRNAAEKNGRMSHVLLSMASDERVLRETPSLQRHAALIVRLDAFLGRKST